MSYGHGRSNGYTNGYRAQEQPNRYEADTRNVPSGGGTRARRTGGYGGFFANDIPEQDSPVSPDGPDPFNPPPIPSWRREGNHRAESDDQDRPRQNVIGRMYGDGPGGRQIEGVVDHIYEKWDIITKNDCVPVHIALQLMDYSSLGRGNDYEDFKQTNKALQRALKSIVNEHHQGFNSSIGTFHKIQASIQTSQHRVRALKTTLTDAKGNLTTPKAELRNLVTSSQTFDDMLQVLDQIEKVQLMPEILDTQISDKHFISAVETLQNALRLVRHSSLENIGALSDLKVYLNNQENSLADILLEELHDHLYLKSPYCTNRWKPHSPMSRGASDPGESLDGINNGVRPLYRFLAGLNTTALVADDASKNPEADSFEYMQMIFEALNKMGRLDLAMDSMEQRLPIELFAVVERTNREVDVRHPEHLRPVQDVDESRPYLSIGKNDGSDVVLHDLLYTLYSKFEAIAESHRAVHEIVAGIVQREGLRKSATLMGSFKELWKLYQSEMRSLLHDYLATDGNPYSAVNTTAAEVNLFRKQQRDKSKRVFKLGELDKKDARMAGEQEEIDKILLASVPGLVSKSQTSVAKGDRSVTYESPAAGHKLLVKPLVFNIGLLLPLSLSFLQRLKDIVPPDSDIAISTLTSFLDDFLVNVFNPQLEETVTEMCMQSYTELDSFQQDARWAIYGQRPLFKGTTTFFGLIKAFCRILDNIPQDQAFSQLIITQLRAYYDRCLTWFQGLVSRVQADGSVVLKTAARLVQSGDISILVKSLASGDESERPRLVKKEVDLLIAETNARPIEPYEIISDRRSVSALCLLYSSMHWLASSLEQLRHVEENDLASTSEAEAKATRQSQRWTIVSNANVRDVDRPASLRMTRETAGAFDEILKACRALGLRALQTLHIDIRCGMIHMISRVLKSHHLLLQPVREPDPSILALNSDLLSFDDTLTVHLPSSDYAFITTGLGHLLDEILVTNASQIPMMNRFGCERMELNILVLQQNLKSVERDVMLARSAQFFDFFHQGAKFVVGKAAETGGKDLGFNLEELKVLIELCYSEALQSNQRDVAAQAKRALNDHQLQLAESMWSS